ncbi:MAG: Txe/YoeB family addiction module toxin [Pyramidobacter sp.]|jgi:toxin YoeB
MEIIRNDPYQTPPLYEKLRGDLKGAYSRRINLKHRLVYEVLEAEQTIKIISLWTHYER